MAGNIRALDKDLKDATQTAKGLLEVLPGRGAPAVTGGGGGGMPRSAVRALERIASDQQRIRTVLENSDTLLEQFTRTER